MTDVMLVFLMCKNEMHEIHGDVFSFQFFTTEWEGV